jgi:hypothetical protein
MYLLYVDESGNPDNPADRYFVLAGAAIFERQTFHLSHDLDGVQRRHFPGLPPVTFHATDIRSGSGFWRTVDKDKRRAILQEIGDTIAQANVPGVVLFGAAIEKTDALYGEAAVERATEEVCRRFDIFLMRRRNEFNDPQRGLLVFAEGRFHQRARLWVKGFRNLGTRWGVLVNLADIPYFASAAETRLLQIADFVAHAVYLLYERRDPSLFRSMIGRFEQKEGIIHGLVHIARPGSTCDCPYCASRRTPYAVGSWL